jgi:hypothetical protein
MKIITRKQLGDKVVGNFTCKRCKSELEVQIRDCYAGMASDYSGDKDSYVGCKCPVCGNFIDLPGVSYTEVNDYHKTVKAIEEAAGKQITQERIPDDAGGK